MPALFRVLYVSQLSVIQLKPLEQVEHLWDIRPVSRPSKLRGSTSTTTGYQHNRNNSPLETIGNKMAGKVYRILRFEGDAEDWQPQIQLYGRSKRRYKRPFLHFTFTKAEFIARKTYFIWTLHYANFAWWPRQSCVMARWDGIEYNATRFISHEYSGEASVSLFKSSLPLSVLTKRNKLVRISFICSTFYSPSRN